MKKAKINHTEGVAVGFSAVIPKSGNDSYATMDLSKFVGKTINVGLYLRSESQGSVTLGILEKEKQELATAQIDAEWTQVTFSYQFSEDDCERALFFQGDGTDDFYVDDISITMVDEKDRYETQVLKGGETGETIEEPAADESVEDDSNTDQGDVNNAAQQPNPSSETNNGAFKTIIVLCVIIVFVGIIAYIVKKKAGKN